MTTFTFELAVSAVKYDAALVNELLGIIAPQVRSKAVWDGGQPSGGVELHGSLAADRSRVALIVHQRLWPHEDSTTADAAILRARLRDRPSSVCVVTLDDTPLPAWLAKAPRCDLAAVGVRGAAEFVLETIVSCGGSVSEALRDPEPPTGPAVPGRWLDSAPQFLSQLRAQSALRHELDALAASLKSELDVRRAHNPEGTYEMHTLPHRFVVRLGDAGVSFSWVGNATSAVAEGRLLVIEWRGVMTETRGIAALKSAKPLRERVYRPEATDADHWQWRADEEHGQAYSTAHLVADWLANSSVELATGGSER